MAAVRAIDLELDVSPLLGDIDSFIVLGRCAHCSPRATDEQSGALTCETVLTDAPRLQRFEELSETLALPDSVLDSLERLGLELFQIRQGPLVYPTTPGTSRLCLELDLSDRAVELISAAWADLDVRV